MACSVVKFFLMMFLAFNKIQNSANDVFAQEKLDCAKDINEEFGVNPGERKRHIHYAKYALLHHHIDESNETISTMDTKSAKEYYKIILLHIHPDRNMPTLEEFCPKKEKKIKQRCEEHLNLHFEKKPTKLELLRWIYRNIIFELIPKEHIFAKIFMERVKDNFIVNNNKVELPTRFCGKYINKINEIKVASKQGK